MATCSLDGCYRRCFERAGIVHDYCGRTHAREAVNKGMLYALAPPHGNCHRCQLHGCSAEVFFDQETQTVHDFCSRRHATMAAARGQWPRRDSQGSRQCQTLGCDNAVYRDHVTGEDSQYCSRSHAAQAKAELSSECNNPRCFRPAWVDARTGLLLGYCGSACAHAHEAYHLISQDKQCSLPGCVNFTLLNKHTGADLGYCADIHLRRAASRSLCPNTEPHVDRTFMAGTSVNGFKLSVLTNQHPAYFSLKEQFFSKWQKEDNNLRVERIFKVEVPRDVHQKHADYEKSKPNTRRRFHGTQCSDECNFFVDLKGGPCGRPDCSVCSICMHGFKLQGNLGRTAKATNVNLRYGEGLYFSSVSGKANDYANESEKFWKDKHWRCMFTASVVVGRPYVTQEARLPADMCPPQGYDAVVGEVGTNLNHDEVVVYNEDAPLPTYLIVYSTV